MMTKGQVVLIRKLVADGVRAAELAKMYGVTTRCITYIAAGRSYPNYPGPRVKGLGGRVGRLPRNADGSDMNRSDKNKRDRRIFNLRRKGATYQSLSEQFGLTPGWISRLVRRMECRPTME